MDPSGALAADYSQRADSYARHWAPVIHPMARPLLDAMPFTEARKILDVGTGTGGLWPLIQSAAPAAQLYGVDRADGMLRAGSDRLHGRVAVMDAERLGVRAANFEAALLLFVLQHIPDPVRALHEICIALKPGGFLGVVVWGEDPGLPGGAIWAEELDRAQAAPDPRDPSVMRQSWMDTTSKLTGLLQQAGFDSDRVWSLRFVHAWTVDKLLATQTLCGLASRRLESLSAGAQRECTDRVRTRFQQLSAGELEYHTQVIYGIAQRPE